MKPTRRQVVIGGSVALAACGRTELELDEGPDPFVDPFEEEDDVNVNAIKSQPLVVSARTTLASNTTGGVNTVALRNPMNRPMEILAVQFELDMEILGAAGINILPNNVMGGLIAVKMELGQYPITNGYVPVWSLGRSEQWIDEDQGTVALPTVVGFLTVNTPVGTALCANQNYLWRLPRPLFVPAGSVVTPTFQHRGLFTESIDVNISYICRSLPIGYEPKKILVPYASSFITPNFDLDSIATSGDTEQSDSTETDLINPFDTELYLQRFTGRSFVYNNGSPEQTAEGAFTPVSAYIDAATTVRMADSHGRPIIPFYTPFRTAFAGVTRSWEMDAGHMLDPQSYYLASLRVGPLAPTIFVGEQFTLQAQIGVVGWREIK